MKNENLVPKVRFKEFSDPWEQCKFHQVLDVHSGKDYKHLRNGAIPVYGTGGYMLSVNENLSDVDAIGIGRKGTIDKPQYLSAPFWTVDTLFFLTAHVNYNLLLLFYISESICWKKYDESTGVPSLSKRTISSIPIEIPQKYTEQENIGKMFLKTDSLIAANEDKLEQLKTLKKLMMQKIFSQEWRFKGFTDPWEQRKLGDYGNIAMNRRIFKEETSTMGDIPFYKIGTFGKNPDAFISQKRFIEYKNKYPYPKKGDILISASGSIGRTIEYQGENAYYQDSNIVWLNHDGRLVNSFLKQFYLIVRWNGLEGSTIKRLYNKNILKTNICVPLVDEQNKIGSFLSKLDSLIAANEDKLNQLKKLKKYLMQNMFV